MIVGRRGSIVEADETDTVFLNRHHSPGLRALRTGRSEELEKFEGNVMGEFGQNIMDLYFGGKMESAVALCGQVAGRIDSVRPVADVIQEASKEFFEVMDNMAENYVKG